MYVYVPFQIPQGTSRMKFSIEGSAETLPYAKPHGYKTVCPLTRLRGLGHFRGFGPLKINELIKKVFTTAGCQASAGAAIRGGGWGGKWSLSRWIRSCNSGSGWVQRVRTSSRPSVVGTGTSII